MDFWIRVKTSFDGKGFNEAKAKLGGFLKQGLVAGGKVAVASLAAVGSAAVATTVKAVDFADETNAAMETFAQSTGVATDKLNAYKDVALDVFSGQFGESVEDVAETMALIERNTGAGAEEIGGLTEKALLLRDTFGKDVEETLRTVDSLIKNGVARNADEAFDIIVAGMQQGADKAGDLTDTLNEYAQDFGSLQFTAADTLSVINSGLEAGILNSDKIGDALNEAFINIKDPAVVEALGEIDGGLAQTAEAFNRGAISGKEAFELMQDQLAAIEDPIARNQAGVLLYRSMWEDLGEDAVLALSTVDSKFEDIAGVTDKALERNLSLSESWENLGRRTLVALEPIGQEIAPVLIEFTEKLGDKLDETLPKVADSFNRIAVALGLVGEGATGAEGGVAILEATLEGALGIIDAVAAAIDFIADGIEGWKKAMENLGAIQDLTGGMTFGEVLSGVGEGLGFSEGGTVGRGQSGRPVRATLHEGEVVANPAMGQAVTVGGETFAVHEAQRMGAAIERHTRNVLQVFTNELADNLA